MGNTLKRALSTVAMAAAAFAPVGVVGTAQAATPTTVHATPTAAEPFSAIAGGHPIAGDPVVSVGPTGIADVFARGDNGTSLVPGRSR
ncbi:MAG: hypothetical protein JWP46_827 [Modestobacter sp.]|nr:hypothetical protein [Modestobacter sp.]